VREARSITISAKAQRFPLSSLGGVVRTPKSDQLFSPGLYRGFFCPK